MSNSTASSTDGAPDAVRLGGWDYATWRAGVGDPILRAPLVAVVHLAGQPDAELIRERLERARLLPALNRRLALLGGHPHLVPSQVDPRAQLEIVPPEIPTAMVLKEAIEREFTANLPPWRIHLSQPQSGGTVLTLVMDHVIADGRAALGLAASLLDGWEPPASSGRVGLRLADKEPGVGDRSFSRNVASALDLARSVLRMTRVHSAPLSPLFAARSLQQDRFLISGDIRSLRQSARSGGVTANDALVAGVLSAVGKYHSVRGETVAALRVNVPISLRSRSAERGNSLAIARATLPVPVGDDRLAARAIHDHLLNWRAEAALGHSDRLAEASRALSVPALALLARTSDLTISNLGPVLANSTLAGVPVVRVYPVPSTIGVAVSVALLTYGEIGCVGLTVDPAAVRQPQELAAGIAAELGFEGIIF